MNFRPPSRCSLLTTVAGSLVALALTAPASAQQVVGGTTSPNVFVDQGVLDQLGRTPNLADVLGGGRLNAPARLSRNAPGELQFPVIGEPQGSQPGQIKLRPPTKKAATSRRTRKQTTARRAPAPPAPPTMAAPVPLQAPPPKMAATPVTRPAPAAPEARMQPPAPPAMPDAPRPPTSAPITSPQPPAAPDIPAAPGATASMAAPPAPPELPPTAKAPAAKARDANTTVAALPEATSMTTSGKLGVGSSVRVGFTPGSTKLDSPAEENLKKIASALKEDEALRIQLLAYAGATGDSASQARRLSLSRALAARSSLISQGVKSARIDVRALGNKSEGGPPDRIDIIVTKR